MTIRSSLVALSVFLVACGTPPPRAVPVASRPTAAPAPTATPVATETPAARYVRLAKAGATLPIVRAGKPKGEWKADVTNTGNGPEVTLTMPVSVGFDSAQTVRQAKRHIAQVVKAIFDGDPAVARITVTGTTPDAADGSEQAAVSIFITRDAFAAWNGTAETLGDWRIAPRYQ